MHTQLHQLPDQGEVATAGRWRSGRLASALTSLSVITDAAIPEGALVRVWGEIRAGTLHAHQVDIVYAPTGVGLKFPELGNAICARHRAYLQIRTYFAEHGFIEVETPNWVTEPGTDVYLDPVEADFVRFEQRERGYLHTSPEFYMKEMLTRGVERAFQLCKVYRNGEVSLTHNPEFTILEWYRAWEGVDAIMADVEALSRRVVSSLGEAEFVTMTMTQVVAEAAGFDLMRCLTAPDLAAACLASGAFVPRPQSTWEALFFELVVTRIDPYLETRGAVFVTEWPIQLAVLAAPKPGDPRVALRFELYVHGVEVANGFQELTDPAEQRRRFQDDIESRASLGRPKLPMPERFLDALAWGLPPSAGVAVGVDRLLMLALGEDSLVSVLPFRGHTF